MHGLLGLHRINNKAEFLKQARKKYPIKRRYKPVQQKEEPAERPHIVHTSNKVMRCVFNSVVIRNESLNQKYEGGLVGYLQTHGSLTNNDISVFCSMGDEIDLVVKDLIDNGLHGGDDFTFVDAGGYSMQVAISKEDCPHNISVGVDWLEARYAKGGIWVWYVKGD